jgi:hypothetical protein
VGLGRRILPGLGWGDACNEKRKKKVSGENVGALLADCVTITKKAVIPAKAGIQKMLL